MSVGGQRIPVKAKVVEVLKALAATEDHALNGVTITYNLPNKSTDVPSPEGVIVGHIDGSQTTATFSAAGSGRDELFKIRLVIIVTGKATEQAADERAEAIANAIAAALFAGPRLNTGTGPIPGVAVDPGEYDGPNSGPRDGGGIESWAALELSFRGRLTAT